MAGVISMDGTVAEWRWGYGACCGCWLVSLESPLILGMLSSYTIPQSYSNCAAGGRDCCMYHDSSKNAWWLLLIRAVSRS
jgi:hypothetical protein